MSESTPAHSAEKEHKEGAPDKDSPPEKKLRQPKAADKEGKNPAPNVTQNAAGLLLDRAEDKATDLDDSGAPAPSPAYPAAAKLINQAALAHTIGTCYLPPFSESEVFYIANADEQQRIATDIAILQQLHPHYASEDGGLVQLILLVED